MDATLYLFFPQNLSIISVSGDEREVQVRLKRDQNGCDPEVFRGGKYL